MKLLLVAVLLLGVAGSARCELDVGKKPNLLQLAVSLNLTTFVEEIKKVGIDKVINHEGKFTVFAPTNEAFAHETCYPSEASLKDKLRFHVAWGEVKAAAVTNEKTLRTLLPRRTIRLNVYNKGQVVTANGRQIVSTDHEAHNGIIHVVSDVMSSVYDREGSVVSELEDCCPHHSRVIELVKKAGLYSFLDRRGPFTFLAPTNGAFAKLHPDYINHLIKNKTALRIVLLSHVIPGTVYSPGLKNGDVVKTLSGTKLCVGVKTGEVQIGTAKVQLIDVTAGNGAIHTLDTVQFPNQHAECATETAAKMPSPFHYRNTKMGHSDFFAGFDNFVKEVEAAKRLPVGEKVKPDKDVRGQTLLHQMEEDASLTSFRTMIVDAGLGGLFLQTHYPWTVFAPTDSALETAFSKGGAQSSVAKLVFGHVLPKTLNDAELGSETGSIFTAAGGELKRQITDEGQIMLNGVKVRPAGRAANGVLFKVDRLLV